MIIQDLKITKENRVKFVSVFIQARNAVEKGEKFFLHQKMKYDVEGRIIDKIFYDLEGKQHFRKIFCYNNTNTKLNILSIWNNHKFKDELEIYDESMNLIKAQCIYSDGRSYRRTFKYNEQGKLILVIYESESDIFREEYSYDLFGNLNGAIHYKNNTIIFEEKYRNIYDNKNRKIDELIFNENISDDDVCINKVSAFCKEIIFMNENNEVDIVTTETKDEAGNLIETKDQNSRGEILSRTKYYYGLNNLLIKIRYKNYVNKIMETAFYKYSFYENR